VTTEVLLVGKVNDCRRRQEIIRILAREGRLEDVVVVVASPDKN
jgi:hypothetical protein